MRNNTANTGEHLVELLSQDGLWSRDGQGYVSVGGLSEDGRRQALCWLITNAAAAYKLATDKWLRSADEYPLALAPPTYIGAESPTQWVLRTPLARTLARSL